MYHFSRSIYRELSGYVVEKPCWGDESNRQQFLAACEAAVERLATDRHYFARPARTLFTDVRFLFPMAALGHVHDVIERYMTLATEYVDRHAEAGLALTGGPLSCHATTRRGSPCQRVPLPGRRYCPSHQHLEEAVTATAA